MPICAPGNDFIPVAQLVGRSPRPSSPGTAVAASPGLSDPRWTRILAQILRQSPLITKSPRLPPRRTLITRYRMRKPDLRHQFSLAPPGGTKGTCRSPGQLYDSRWPSRWPRMVMHLRSSSSIFQHQPSPGSVASPETPGPLPRFSDPVRRFHPSNSHTVAASSIRLSPAHVPTTSWIRASSAGPTL